MRIKTVPKGILIRRFWILPQKEKKKKMRSRVYVSRVETLNKEGAKLFNFFFLFFIFLHLEFLSFFYFLLSLDFNFIKNFAKLFILLFFWQKIYNYLNILKLKNAILSVFKKKDNSETFVKMFKIYK